MKEYFIRMFRYNEWANHHVYQTIIMNKVEDEQVLKLFSHIINAEYIWIERIFQKEYDKAIWGEHSIRLFPAMIKESTELWTAFLHTSDESTMDMEVCYTNSKGERYCNSICDIITHVISHGTYHRGQLIKMIRQLGLEPPVMDYIIYRRTQSVMEGKRA